jgi:hypothetical protein
LSWKRTHKSGELRLDMASPELERSAEVRRFSPAARGALKKKGYVVYELAGRSIRSLREAGRPSWSTWHNDYPEFETLNSTLSEVAINPKRPFLPDSNSKTIREQRELVGQYSELVRRISRKVGAAIGQAPDYAELYFAHLDATGEHLFENNIPGTEGEIHWASTLTTAMFERVGQYQVIEYDAIVGYAASGYRVPSGDELAVEYQRSSDRREDVFLAPLIVPIGG